MGNILYGIHGICKWIFGLTLHKPKLDLRALGSRVRALRGESLQEELAAYLHIRQGHLSKIETGKAAPTLEVLILLSDRFHKSIDWIVRGSPR
jgi:DNA-binding XRE family transcriptional regulator